LHVKVILIILISSLKLFCCAFFFILFLDKKYGKNQGKMMLPRLRPALASHFALPSRRVSCYYPDWLAKPLTSSFYEAIL